MLTGDDDSPHFAQAIVKMNSAEGGIRTIREIQRTLDATMPEAQVLALQLEQGPPFKAPIELKLYGPDLDRLRTLGSDEARGILAAVPDVLHTQSTLADGRPKLSVRLDEADARVAGLSNVDIASQLDAQLEGTHGGSLIEDTEQLPVRVRLRDGDRDSAAALASIDIFARGGTAGTGVSQTMSTGMANDKSLRNVPLSAVASLELLPELASIERRDGQRSNTVRAYITAGVLPQEVLGPYQQRLEDAGFQLPAGYTMRWGGEADKRDEAVGNLMASVAVLAVLMAATLVLALGSFKLAAIIGGVAILSVGLGTGALWIFGFPFGFHGDRGHHRADRCGDQRFNRRARRA